MYYMYFNKFFKRDSGYYGKSFKGPYESLLIVQKKMMRDYRGLDDNQKNESLLLLFVIVV